MDFPAQDIFSILRKTCDWQLKNLPAAFTRISGKREKILNNGWIRSAFYAGVIAAWQATGERKYLEAAFSWSEQNHWQPGRRPRLADNHCAGQFLVMGQSIGPVPCYRILL